MHKRSFAMVLLFLFCSSFFCVSAQEQELLEVKTQTEQEMGGYIKPVTKGTQILCECEEEICAYGLFDTDYEAMFAYMYAEILAGNDTIDLHAYSCKVDDFFAMFELFSYLYPCAFVDFTQKIHYYYYTFFGSEYMDSVTVPVLFSPEERGAAKQEVDTEINGILSNIDASLSETEKLLLIHDELVDRITYDTESAASGTNGKAFSIYGAMVDDTSVCMGYAYSLSYICTKLGIAHKPCVYDANEERDGHIWNYVQLDGEWYHLDATWDDPSSVVAILHENFLTSDEFQIEDKGLADFYSPSVYDDTPVCSDKRYESGCMFNGIRGKITYQNGSFLVQDLGVNDTVQWEYELGSLSAPSVMMASAALDGGKEKNNLTVRLKNNVGKLDNAVFYIVYYDENDRFLKTEVVAMPVKSASSTGYKLLTLTVDANTIQQGTAKLFLWNGTNFAPYGSSPRQIEVAN